MWIRPDPIQHALGHEVAWASSCFMLCTRTREVVGISGRDTKHIDRSLAWLFRKAVLRLTTSSEANPRREQLPKSIEEISSVLGRLPPGHGDRRDAEPLAADRVYLARGPNRASELFIRGSRASFTQAPTTGPVAWGKYRISETDQELPALVLRTGSHRLMAHIAYEVSVFLEHEPSATNSEILRRISPFLGLLAGEEALSPEEQTGLMGELQVLHELLAHASTISQRAAALESWRGPTGAKRDFFTAGWALEVKSAPDPSRHEVSLEQLLADPGERLFIASVQVTRDYSAPLRLDAKVARIEALLDDTDAIIELRSKLRGYGGAGYDPDDVNAYALEPGFFIEPMTIRELDDEAPILRPRSFRDGNPPSNVHGIRYTLDVSPITAVQPAVREQLLSALAGRVE